MLRRIPEFVFHPLPVRDIQDDPLQELDRAPLIIDALPHFKHPLALA
ncbi:hypothetical protein SDC9_201181 [bioreactor metagenome]|uniref:Uncharacterized protein n=1 Tax=bioreactor metagenome TaxID=1076179 RepID=A0A645IQJ9_9ZZZZ